MTIKKTKPAPAPASVAPASGGATIADRFKLDVPDASAKKGGGTVGKKSTMIALAAGLAALAVAGILTLVLYQHWDFLCNQGA